MIYIQSIQKGAQIIPHHFDASCAMYGAMDLGLDFKLVHYEQLEKYGTLVKNQLFVGSVEFMTEVFRQAGISPAPRLPENSNRISEKITLGEAKMRASAGEKLFIKPVEIKLFTGFVLDASIYSCIKNLPDDVPVLTYKPFDKKIRGEYRIYIHNHRMVDAHCYAGDFMAHPEYGTAQNIIEENKEKGFPCAYTMDIAIFWDSRTTVIEYNDMWAIGNYGMPNDTYVHMLMDRYFEIMKK